MKRTLIVVLVLVIAVLACCGRSGVSDPTPAAAPFPTMTPYPTYTPYPTPILTATLIPTLRFTPIPGRQTSDLECQLEWERTYNPALTPGEVMDLIMNREWAGGSAGYYLKLCLQENWWPDEVLVPQ